MSDRIPEELLSAYLDGELSPSEKTDVERELEASLPLRERLAELEEVSLQIKMLPRPPAPPELRRTVLDTIDRGTIVSKSPNPSQDKSLWGRPSTWSAVAVVACLLVMAGSWSLKQSGKLDRNQLTIESLAMESLAQTSQPDESFEGYSASPASPMMAEMDHNFSADTARLSGRGMPSNEDAPPVQVVSLSKDEIRERIENLGRAPVLGNSIKVPASLKNDSGETPIVVVFTVVDVVQAMNQMQVLVQREQIRSKDNQILPLNLKQSPTRSDDSQLTTVTLELEMDGPEMAEVLNNIAAFDAVVYVEEGTEPLTDQLAADDSVRRRTEQQSDSEAVDSLTDQLPQDQSFARGGKKSQQSPLAADKDEADQEQAEQPMQFDFRQLAAGRNSLQENGIASRAMKSAAGQSGASSRLKNEKKRMTEDRPAATSAPSAEPSMAAAESSKPQVPEERKQASSRLAKELPEAGATRQDWEAARRFRAFILLKQQAPVVKTLPE